MLSTLDSIEYELCSSNVTMLSTVDSTEFSYVVLIVLL